MSKKLIKEIKKLRKAVKASQKIDKKSLKLLEALVLNTNHSLAEIV